MDLVNRICEMAYPVNVLCTVDRFDCPADEGDEGELHRSWMAVLEALDARGTFIVCDGDGAQLTIEIDDEIENAIIIAEETIC